MNCIVTTTINPPTEAIRRFVRKEGWDLIIVGDLKTPHDEWRGYPGYFGPDEQHTRYQKLSEATGWNCIQRRNIGFVEAYRRGCYDVIATVDDDNIPYENWGENCLVGKVVDVDLWRNTAVEVFDPLSVTNHPELWHRGYPIEFVPHRGEVEYLGRRASGVVVQADLWDGDPDVDAMVRLSQAPTVKFNDIAPYTSRQISPFNSQNTFIAANVLPFYCCFPGVGRMDDIWGSYVFQHLVRGSVVYSRASVYQDRNEQDLVTNLEQEIAGYRGSFSLARWGDSDGRLRDVMKRLGIWDYWEVYREAFYA